MVAETGDSWFHCQKLKLPEGRVYCIGSKGLMSFILISTFLRHKKGIKLGVVGMNFRFNMVQ